MTKSEQKVHSFHKDTRHGDYGEYIVKKFYIEHLRHELEYAEDKSNNKNYQGADVDLLVKYKTGDIEAIEVKNDRQTSGNMFYEIVSQSRPGETDVDGCMLTTEAETLIYVFEHLNLMMLLNMERLREWVKSYLDNGGYLEKKNVLNHTYMSQGYLIPVEKMMGENLAWAAVDGIKMIDIDSGEKVSFEKFEERRKEANDLESPIIYERDKHWFANNKNIWTDRNVLDIPLKADIEEFNTIHAFYDDMFSK